MTALMLAEQVSKRFERPLSLTTRFARRLGDMPEPAVHAVNRVSISLARGEVLGLVGESGCGKSTLGRMLAGILAPTEGRVSFDGRPIMTSGRSPRKCERRVQMVFQNPFASLNPRMKVGRAIAEGPMAHGLVRADEADAYAAQWLERVGLERGHAERHPHQFSGGQRQRIAIARALAMKPDVLICDEPIASLDVSIQAQITNLFLRLRAELSLTMLFISHDLSIVRHICDRVAVMYLGRLVEVAPAATIYRTPRHPYTRALLDSVPQLMLDGSRARFHVIAGEIPSSLAPPSGCHFRTRCPRAATQCAESTPPLVAMDKDTYAACYYPEYPEGRT